MDKNFIPYLYERNSIPSMIKHYASPMIQSPNLLTQMKGKQLLGYRAALIDEDFKNSISNAFNELFELLSTKFPPNILYFEIFGRIKALFSSLNKIEELEEKTIMQLKKKFIENSLCKEEFSMIESLQKREELFQEKIAIFEGNEQFNDEFANKLTIPRFVGNNPFERMHDYYAFRIVVEDLAAEELLENLYEIANDVIEHFSRKGFEIAEHERLLEIGKNIPKNQNIVIPSKDIGVKPEFKNYVKDYVKKPKESGYQGLHIVLREPLSARLFEIQLRTRSMDLIAETLASHEVYKASKYGSQQKGEDDIDFSRIHVRGFRYMEYETENGIESFIHDTAGIKNPVVFIRKRSAF